MKEGRPQNPQQIHSSKQLNHPSILQKLLI